VHLLVVADLAADALGARIDVDAYPVLAQAGGNLMGELLMTV